jgi:dTDP-4-dehydrorhamnose reductase
MRILVTGAAGQLGESIRRATEDSVDTYLFTDVAELDITNREAVMGYVADNKVDVIVNCAAYTNVERAEEEEAVAHLLNATAVCYLAEAAKANDALLIHISTDYVFMGGCCAMLTEESHPQPLNAYGRTKLAGEEAVKASGCHYMILRTAWLYSAYGHNFLKTMLRLTSERGRISVVNDQIGTPTYAGDLAAAIIAIIEGGKTEHNDGIYHFSNDGICSWYDFSREIARVAGNTHCEICPCLSSEYPSKVTRPTYSVLDKSKIKRTFNVAVPYWTESVARCINKLMSDR